MSDKFKFNQEAITSVYTNLVSKANEYQEVVNQLTNLVKEIDSSSSWTDADVKSAFISSINSYVNYFNSSHAKMVGYTEYLKQKTDATSQFEENYSKG